MNKNPLIYLGFAVGSFFCADKAVAQSLKPGLLLGVNAVYSKPSANFSNSYKAGIGGEIVGGIGLGKTFLVATAGSTRFISNKEATDFTYQPFKVGIRQYIFGKRLFINADLGTAKIRHSNKDEVESQPMQSFGAGARLLGFELGVAYEGWNNSITGKNNNSILYKLGWSVGL